MRLDVDEGELAACVSCGLCLPHCPTYRVTGEESAAPRGRIAAMRATNDGSGPPSEEFRLFMERCVQCRGCETACPSSVPFGRLIEGSLASLATADRWMARRRRLAFSPVAAHHRALLALSSAAALAQRAHLMPASLGLPRLTIRRERLHPTGSDAWLFTGCVMDAWMRPVHAAVLRVASAAGYGLALPRGGGACCGALHLHVGLRDVARRLAARTVSSMPGEAQILVDSAGCAAMLADYPRLLGTPEAEAFAKRVVEVDHWLASRLDMLPDPARRAGLVAVQDPCHLRHALVGHRHVLDVLERFCQPVTLDDEGLCCGAGGAYSLAQPELSARIRDLKVASVRRTRASIVASANPGCVLHLRAAGLDVRHPLEIVDWALGSPEVDDLTSGAGVDRQ